MRFLVKGKDSKFGNVHIDISDDFTWPTFTPEDITSVEPSSSSAVPTPSSAKPTRSSAKPTRSSAKPTLSSAQPTLSSVEPTDSPCGRNEQAIDKAVRITNIEELLLTEKVVGIRMEVDPELVRIFNGPFATTRLNAPLFE